MNWRERGTTHEGFKKEHSWRLQKSTDRGKLSTAKKQRRKRFLEQEETWTCQTWTQRGRQRSHVAHENELTFMWNLMQRHGRDLSRELCDTVMCIPEASLWLLHKKHRDCGVQRPEKALSWGGAEWRRGDERTKLITEQTLQRTASTGFWATDCGMWGRERAQEGPGCVGSEWLKECKWTTSGCRIQGSELNWA